MMSDYISEELRVPVLVGLAVGVASIAAYLVYRQYLKQARDVEDMVDGRKVAPLPKTHKKARGPDYPRDPTVVKFDVPDRKVAWSVSFPEYKPVDYTAPSVQAQPVWADPDVRTENCLLQWNSIDGEIDRRSHSGPYKIVNGLPRNPVGRTGMIGRGLLGKWGPNHAADPIVTRWKRHDSGSIVTHPESGKPILQFVCIQRRDSGQWAIPGGMVDPGESVSVVLKREFAEEAMNILEQDAGGKEQIKKIIDGFFIGGTEVYRGYVDDPRNTDNSWMETVAVNFHDETGEGVGRFHLHAGDDAVKVQWSDLDGSLPLYASHLMFVKAAADLHNCHW